MPSFTYIDRAEDVAAAIDGVDVVGVDTEFMREKTYFSQLCLIQIATANEIFCVDPLPGGDAQALWQPLLERTWVLHSARQDIEVVFHTAGTMPESIFDTQIAAGLLGFAPQIGYAALIEELFDVQLEKSHTRADWTRRPLPDAFLMYAAEDVEFLLRAHEVLTTRLEQCGRLDWAWSDSRTLLDPSLYDIDPMRAVERLKGAKNLSGRRRAAATRLAAWRESRALRRDLPRQWILKDRTLLEIAEKLPSDRHALASIEDLPKKVVQRAGAEILSAIADSATDADDYVPPQRPNEQQKAVLKRMQQRVAKCAEQLGIAAETIASKKELSAVIIGGNRNSRVFDGWRKDLVGDKLLELL